MSDDAKAAERYVLCVEQGPHSDLFVEGPDMTELKFVAYQYLCSGRRCFILDRETNEQTNLSLKEMPRG